MTGILDFIAGNLGHVAPILIAGAIAIAISIERFRALYVVYPIAQQDDFFATIQELVLSDRLPEAVAICERKKEKPVAMVMKEALMRAHQPETLIEHGVQMAISEATLKIQNRTLYLSMIANVATLLGLFGTIAGLISSFEAVGQADPQQKSALLAAGISTAMNATMLGLAVAIPAMVVFSILANRTNRMVGDVEHAAVKSVDLIKQRYFGVEQRESKAS